MIDDIKDLKVIQEEKSERRQWFTRNFWISFGPMLIAAIGCFVFALFIGSLSSARTKEFLDNFKLSHLGDTISTLFLFLVVVVILFFGLYALNRRSKSYKLGRNYCLCIIMIVINYLVSVTLSSVLKIVYLMPMALTALVIIELLGRREAIIATAILTIFMAFTLSFTEAFAHFDTIIVVSSIICNMVTAMFMLFLVSQHFSRLRFIVSTFFGAILGTVITALSTIAAGALSQSAFEPMTILWNCVYGLAGNVGCILVFMPLVAIFEGIFNIADDFKLDELSNLNHPLLKRLSSEAPGTFNHSLVVGNLAEACAQAIGENPHLARCCAYYHDVGKLKSPEYFAENQSTYNPHDELIPEVSVRMITSHTIFGEILLKQYHMPKEIKDVALQHHGTSPVGYFYRKALSLTEGDIDMNGYAYAGPKPQTKIAAIIMIADTCEAALRAYFPDSKEEFENRINSLVDEKIKLNQFDECPISMGEIATVKRTIMEVLPSVHHSRVDYDKDKR